MMLTPVISSGLSLLRDGSLSWCGQTNLRFREAKAKMTRAQIRRTAWEAHDRIEWLNTHVQARAIKDNKQLEDSLKDLRKMMLRIIDAPIREPKEEGELE